LSLNTFRIIRLESYSTAGISIPQDAPHGGYTPKCAWSFPVNFVMLNTNSIIKFIGLLSALLDRLLVYGY